MMSSTGAMCFVAGVIEQKSDIEILLERIISLESKVQELQLKLKIGEFNAFNEYCERIGVNPCS